jgi:hypothetical protein
MGPVARYFKFAERGTNIITESRAGLTTFMVMCYIIFLNGAIMAKPLGLDRGHRCRLRVVGLHQGVEAEVGRDSLAHVGRDHRLRRLLRQRLDPYYRPLIVPLL